MSRLNRSAYTSRSASSSQSRKPSKTSRHATKRKHLILDLDNTLLCSKPTKPTTLITTSVYFKYKGMTKQYPKVVERPGLDAFLEKMRSYYYLHIFTSSYKEYAEAMLSGVGIKKYFSSVWHREHCKMIGDSWVKDITALPFSIAEMVLIDDAVIHYENQPDSTILIKPFNGDESDNEFDKLAHFLVELAKCDDIRPIKPKLDYYSIHKCLPSKPTARRVLEIQKQRTKIEDLDFEDSERDLTSLLHRDEVSKEISMYDESFSTENSRFTPSIKTQLKFLRTARPKEQTNSKMIFEMEDFGIEEYFGTEEDMEDMQPSRRINYSHEYDLYIEEVSSMFEKINAVPIFKPNSQYKILSTSKIF